MSFCSVVAVMGGWLMKAPDNLSGLLSSGLVAAGLIFTAKQWRSDVQHKREEAKARDLQSYVDRLDRFRTPKTRAAIMMLLNYDRDIKLEEGGDKERIDWEKTALALVPGNFRSYLYEPDLTSIRDCFNDLLDGMDRLYYLETAGLLRPSDVDHICRPLIRRISADAQFTHLPIARNFRLYVLWRNAQGVIQLFKRYGWDLGLRRSADVEALRREMVKGTYGECEDTGWGNLCAEVDAGSSTKY